MASDEHSEAEKRLVLANQAAELERKRRARMLAPLGLVAGLGIPIGLWFAFEIGLKTGAMITIIAAGVLGLGRWLWRHRGT